MGSDNTKLSLGKKETVETIKLKVLPRRTVTVASTEENQSGILQGGAIFDASPKDAKRLIAEKFAAPHDAVAETEAANSENGSSIHQDSEETVTVGQTKASGAPMVTSVVR